MPSGNVVVAGGGAVAVGLFTGAILWWLGQFWKNDAATPMLFQAIALLGASLGGAGFAVAVVSAAFWTRTAPVGDIPQSVTIEARRGEVSFHLAEAREGQISSLGLQATAVAWGQAVMRVDLDSNLKIDKNGGATDLTQWTGWSLAVETTAKSGSQQLKPVAKTLQLTKDGTTVTALVQVEDGVTWDDTKKKWNTSPENTRIFLLGPAAAVDEVAKALGGTAVPVAP